MDIRPITLKTANKYVEVNHRHHGPVVGCKFAIGLFDGDKMCGVAICGRPVSRILDNGMTLEVNRLCTDGTKNACSMLYSACIRIARAMGYKKVITYILESENGCSVKASNFYPAGTAGALKWRGKRCKEHSNDIQEMKRRWEYDL